MSVNECNQLVRGETLTNTTDHSSTRGTASTAKGFSFGIGGSEQAKKDLRRLRGIIRAERLLVFEPKDISKFTPCQGRYVDYEKIDSEGKCVDDYPLGGEPCRMFDEYCIESYSLDDIEGVYPISECSVGPCYSKEVLKFYAYLMRFIR